MSVALDSPIADLLVTTAGRPVTDAALLLRRLEASWPTVRTLTEVSFEQLTVAVGRDTAIRVRTCLHRHGFAQVADTDTPLARFLSDKYARTCLYARGIDSPADLEALSLHRLLALCPDTPRTGRRMAALGAKSVAHIEDAMMAAGLEFRPEPLTVADLRLLGCRKDGSAGRDGFHAHDLKTGRPVKDGAPRMDAGTLRRVIAWLDSQGDTYRRAVDHFRTLLDES